MLEALKEVFASLKKTSTERISNPFYGVFIFTWVGFNWESIAILLFSEMKMDERVRFINSAYPFIFTLPFLIAIFLTLVIPYCTEKITFLQSRPLGRTSTLLAMRKKKVLIADISVEKYRAKKDIAYNRYRANQEKEIQILKEETANSLARTEELTNHLDTANETIAELNRRIEDEKDEVERARANLSMFHNNEKELFQAHETISNLNMELEGQRTFVNSTETMRIELEQERKKTEELGYEIKSLQSQLKSLNRQLADR